MVKIVTYTHELNKKRIIICSQWDEEHVKDHWHEYAKDEIHSYKREVALEPFVIISTAEINCNIERTGYNKRTTLAEKELYEVMNLAENEAMGLFIFGEADEKSQSLKLTRGNLKTITVPFHVFKNSESKPEFDKLRLIDYGQTIQLGADYEAASSAVLYQLDVEYRIKFNKNLIDFDGSFGASIKRLRLMKEKKQENCEPFTKEDMAAIESNSHEVTGREKLKLAELFQVECHELGTF